MLPDRPELVADIQAWRPKTYSPTFEEKTDPAGRAALIAYERMEPKSRHDFEAAVAELDRLATGTLVAIRHQLKQDGAPQFADLCARAGQAMRKILTLACNTINGGAPHHDENGTMQTRRIAARRAAPVNPSAQSPPAGSDR
jgi:hypothetical protein